MFSYDFAVRYNSTKVNVALFSYNNLFTFCNFLMLPVVDLSSLENRRLNTLSCLWNWVTGIWRNCSDGWGRTCADGPAEWGQLCTTNLLVSFEGIVSRQGIGGGNFISSGSVPDSRLWTDGSNLLLSFSLAASSFLLCCNGPICHVTR